MFYTPTFNLKLRPIFNKNIPCNNFNINNILLFDLKNHIHVALEFGHAS